MHYLVTGHTGFKGSWMIALLSSQGHQISGIALEPKSESLFRQANLHKFLDHDLRVDIRDREALSDAIGTINPDVVIHMAAQSQVLESYEKPIDTYDINVTGTLNVLASLNEIKNLKATVIVTTDKVYKNFGGLHKYNEGDPLGGNDPYSASKAMADILTQSWIENKINSPIGIARAGNVIGGGDFSPNRLIPNLMDALLKGNDPIIRNPSSIRPWQHVLDCLSGYLSLVEYLIKNQESGIWNFGPRDEVCKTVEELSNYVISLVNPKKNWQQSKTRHQSEESILLIDSSKARNLLKWTEKLDFEASVSNTVNWYKNSPQSSFEELIFNAVTDYLDL